VIGGLSWIETCRWVPVTAADAAAISRPMARCAVTVSGSGTSPGRSVAAARPVVSELRLRADRRDPKPGGKGSDQPHRNILTIA
jgi:hypothetical protein